MMIEQGFRIWCLPNSLSPALSQKGSGGCRTVPGLNPWWVGLDHIRGTLLRLVRFDRFGEKRVDSERLRETWNSDVE